MQAFKHKTSCMAVVMAAAKSDSDAAGENARGWSCMVAAAAAVDDGACELVMADKRKLVVEEICGGKRAEEGACGQAVA